MSHRRRVLVVDDEQGIRLALTVLLDTEGYEVRSAGDGREALDILPIWRPDVILLDLMMPVMNGQAFRGAQLGLPDGLPDIPIVVLSGARDAPDVARTLGAAATISKPFDLDRVVATVEEAITNNAGCGS